MGIQRCKPFTATQQDGFGLIKTKEVEGEAWQFIAGHRAMAQTEIEFVSAILVWLEDTTWKLISLLEMSLSTILGYENIRLFHKKSPNKTQKNLKGVSGCGNDKIYRVCQFSTLFPNICMWLLDEG